MECQVADITMYYEEVGAGRPLLTLHGWPLDHRHMAHWFEPLFADRPGWRRLYPDLPGMGRTRGSGWITSNDQMLELVIGFLDAVAPGERFVVGGHSYGGILARGLVHRRGAQIDGVLLHAGVMDREHLPPHQVIHEDPAFLAALAPGEDVLDMVVAQSMELLAELRQFVFPAGAIADRQFLQQIREHEGRDFSFDVDALPSPFPAPALILAGRQDSTCGYREAFQLLDHYPRATFAVLDRAGHGLASEQNTLFRALASEWLDRVEEYAPMAHGPTL